MSTPNGDTTSNFDELKAAIEEMTPSRRRYNEMMVQALFDYIEAAIAKGIHKKDIRAKIEQKGVQIDAAEFRKAYAAEAKRRSAELAQNDDAVSVGGAQ